MQVVAKQKKAEVNISDCVGCGCCKKVCHKNAISFPKGTYAEIDTNFCVGCGKCLKVCPASVIEMRTAI